MPPNFKYFSQKVLKDFYMLFYDSKTQDSLGRGHFRSYDLHFNKLDKGLLAKSETKFQASETSGSKEDF